MSEIRKVQKLYNIDLQSVDEENRQITFCFSDDKPDRQGEIVDQATWDVSNYKQNPVILWGHNPDEAENVLGQGVSIDLNRDGKSFITAQFDDVETNPKADMIFRQLIKRTLRTVSAGFISKEQDWEGDTPVLKNNELLEVSVVAIPANPRAIARALKEGSLSRKDATWLLKSMRSEADHLEEQLKSAPDASETPTMDEASKKQMEAFMTAVTTLAKSVGTLSEKIDKQADQAVTKGAVAEIAALEDKWELEDEKWELMAPVSNFYYALQEAWYYSATPVESFDELVREFASLVSSVLDGNTEKQLPSDERLAKAFNELNEKDVKALTQRALKIETKDVDDDVAAQAATKAAEDEAQAKAESDAEAAEEAAQKAEAEAKAAEATADEVKETKDGVKIDNESDAAKDGEIDQSGAVTEEFDPSAELTPALQAQIDSALEQTLTTTAA